jgi:collagenase-like PrtC family protease
MADSMQRTELLAPAKDLECGIAAIDCGADAVYIGAARFGARVKAGNSLSDIEALARHAHRYWARVYVTVNTLLYDHEIGQAVRLIWQLYKAGADALIVQDVGLLESDLPPLSLIASTQMHNDTPEKVAFLEQVGFHRVILARELSLAQIRAIRERTTIELETFVHGALCVCYSGQCYMSYALGGRSGNRGECAQPCRRRYTLVDGDGNVLVRDRHLLSLRDMDRSAHLKELIEAGVNSFKIEGRLKDRAYVTNVVTHYRRRLDAVLEAGGWAKSSSGESHTSFTPDPGKTFNRGYTTYFLHGRAEPPGAIDSPKMVGEPVGTAARVGKQSFALEAETGIALHNGDGLSFFDQAGTLRGTVVTAVHGQTVTVEDVRGIRQGLRIYRNHDHVYLRALDRARVERKIAVQLALRETGEGFTLAVVDEDGNEATGTLHCEKVRADKPDRALANVGRQLRKTGGTEFTCTTLDVDWQEPYHLSLSALNALRRDALGALADARARNRPIVERAIVANDVPYPQQALTYRGNVLNEKAAAFYRRHGVTQIEPAAESGLDMQGRQVMRTRHCLKHQLGYCARYGTKTSSPREPLTLVDEDGRRFALRFNCDACEMEIVLEAPTP